MLVLRAGCQLAELSPVELVSQKLYQDIDCSAVHGNWPSRLTVCNIDRTDGHATSLVHKFLSLYAFSLCMNICGQPWSPYLAIESPWSEL
jgi:hypothetical protein